MAVSKEKSQEVVDVQKCCPDFKRDDSSDILSFHYRLKQYPVVNNRRIPVEVKTVIRIERIPGPLVLGDLVYTTTLLPGETVRLFSQDRRTRFTYDSATKLSYRHEQTSEERYFMASMSDYMSDLSTRDYSHSGKQSSGSSEGHGDTSGALETLFVGASVDVSGSYSAQSTADFLREFSSHAEASAHAAVVATRAANSVSVGEVQSRTHIESASQEHFESSSRAFTNPNHCHAVTYFFYQLNKTQTIRISLESIERRVIDSAGDARVANNAFQKRGNLGVIPSSVLAHDPKRYDAQVTALRSANLYSPQAAQAIGTEKVFMAQAYVSSDAEVQPLTASVVKKALESVDSGLASLKLVDRVGGSVTATAKTQFLRELHTSLPTPGIVIRGCLDECYVCEPALTTRIELEIEQKKLENELLKKKIELLEKSQEYRCCPPAPVIED